MKVEEILQAQQNFREAVNRETGDGLFLYSRRQDIRKLIDAIWLQIYKAAVTGCDNCYMDNLIIISNLPKSFIMEKAKCNYDLKAGVLLQDTKCGELIKRVKPEMTEHDLMCTRLNLTDFLAEYHLATNPGVEKLFSLLPENWQERADKMRKDLYGNPSKEDKKPKTPPPPPPSADADIDSEKEKALAGKEEEPKKKEEPAKVAKPEKVAKKPVQKGAKPKKIIKKR